MVKILIISFWRFNPQRGFFTVRTDDGECSVLLQSVVLIRNADFLLFELSYCGTMPGEATRFNPQRGFFTVRTVCWQQGRNMYGVF